MTDTPQAPSGVDSKNASQASQHEHRTSAPQVWFHRSELMMILGVYGRLVAAGECRDYAIGGFRGYAQFCMHKHASEAPTWIVEKRPELARRQGAYSVSNGAGLILRRGRDLEQVLKVFDTRRFHVID